jgi:site-specific recombinase XerD
MDAIFEAYLAAQRRRRTSPLTQKAVSHALRSAQRWLDSEGINASELTLSQCEEYFDRLLDRNAVSTVRRHLAYLRAAYRYAERHDLIGSDPTAEVRLPRLPDLEPATYTNDELRAMHAAIRTEREETFFHLLAFAGLRLGETAALTWQSVDLDHWQLRITGKGGKFRLVPLHPALIDLLRERKTEAVSASDPVIWTPQRRPLAARTLGTYVRALADRADVLTAQPSHAYRRTVATVMYEAGVRTRVIERIMGWAPRRMHERHYLRIATEQMHQAILTLYQDDPISERQRHSLNLRPLPRPATDSSTGWLDQETARLVQLESELGLKAG